MGFNLKMMFDELFALLASNEKDSVKIEKLISALASAEKYAKECGQLR